MYYVVFLFSKRKNERVEDENLLSLPMLLKRLSLCIHSFTGWLEAFSFLLQFKENIKTNYSLSSLFWNGWQAWDFLGATGWECCAMAAEHIPAKGMAVEMDQERAEQDWTWKSPACMLANSMHLETLSLPFLSCVFLCIEWAMIAYFLKFFPSTEDPTFP